MQDAQKKIDFVPARWWEAVDFIRLNLETMRGVGDPWAERILARPHSLSSLTEYGYMLDNFIHYNNHFILVSGQRAGVFSTKYRWGFLYVESLGLLPKFLQAGIGTQAAQFMDNYRASLNTPWVVAALAVQNKPVHKLCALFGAYLLGLSTTTLTLAPLKQVSPPPGFEVKALSKAAAQEAWQRWRLYEVEQVAGREVLDIASHVLEALPQGKYMALYQEGEEIGLAVASRHKGEWNVSLFPSAAFWSNVPTANLAAAMAHYLGASIHYLTVTQTHANKLTACESLDFERRLERERHFVVFKRV